ncbi:MAG: hypothetical protein FWF42_00755 [Streptococcaceae bacterium]|nr:hypothetical protein [Streptococcaceae bacterium]MCL2681460.1 hypothetical protein [Streptococcaceae bacterium]MCL2858198.1 hypothetical protein [Streptococcaceae bacterium]
MNDIRLMLGHILHLLKHSVHHSQQLALFFIITLLIIGLLMIIAYFSRAQEVKRELKFY